MIRQQTQTQESESEEDTGVRIQMDKGITFDDDISIDFENSIKYFNEDVTVYNVPSDGIIDESSFELPIDVIESESFIHADSQGIRELPTTFTTDSRAIESSGSRILSDGSRILSEGSLSTGDSSINLAEIVKDGKLIKKRKK